MFEEHCGIAVYSSYILSKENAFFKFQMKPGWCPTPGIQRQGNDGLYQKKGPWKVHKGHLAPSHTLSSSQERFHSTFTYTNAVPQSERFNSGKWSKFEKKIREYARDICTKNLRGQPAGTLYLLTGTSFVFVTLHNKSLQLLHPPVKTFPSSGATSIFAPNSLWTAGCCVRSNTATESFAVIGNNVQNKTQLLTVRVTVPQLQKILAEGVKNRGIGGPNVNLFPGNAACQTNDSKSPLLKLK